jgi:hypothetical protein
VSVTYAGVSPQVSGLTVGRGRTPARVGWDGSGKAPPPTRTLTTRPLEERRAADV